MIKLLEQDNLYPENLRQIKNRPKKIYLEGNIELLETPGIAVIGSRTCSEYGKRMTEKFTKELVEYGLTIISGMAKGVDKYAHYTCLKNLGKTIAVLPNGLNKIELKESKKIYKDILENNGLIITEYEENEEASSEKFLARNRIVSALSIGVLVVEGGYRSGTSVTARIAKEQGKPIFCIPSSLENNKGITPNRLIKQGAHIVTQIEDIIEHYKDLNLKKKENKNEVEELKNIDVSEEEQRIYNILKETKHINEICKELKLSIQEVSSKLMMLELEEKVISLPGNYYKIK